MFFFFSSVLLLLEICQVELTADNTALSIKNKCFHTADNNHRHPPIQYDKRRVYVKVLYRLSTHSLFYVYFFLSVLQTNRMPPKQTHANQLVLKSICIDYETDKCSPHNEWLLWVFCFYWIKDMLHNHYSPMPKLMTLNNLFS